MSFLSSFESGTITNSIDDDLIVNEPRIEQEITAAFKTWQQAISSCDTQNIVCLYQKRAILLPAFDHKLCSTQQERFDYFENLFKKEKLSVRADSLSISPISYTDAIVCGFHTYTYQTDGETHEVRERFRLTYEKIDGKWMIIEHRSMAF